MTQIVLFEGRTEQNQEKINEWLRQNPDVTNIAITHAITHAPMYDFYEAYSPPQIANQYVLSTVYYTPASPKVLPCEMGEYQNESTSQDLQK